MTASTCPPQPAVAAVPGGVPAPAQGGVLALSGGVGGAKLALGLARVLPPHQLTLVVNVGDDFQHLGLSISPDLDTLLYTLAGLADPVRGWGRAGDTWHFMDALQALGGDGWFRLGDADLALHLERTHRLAEGDSLSAVTASFCQRLGVGPRVLPSTDNMLRTRLYTDEGWLNFQDYFVRRRCMPRVRRVYFSGALSARPAPGVLQALQDPLLRAVVLCPSNPFLSIDPILAVPGLRAALAECAAPVIAVSPLVGGQAVKGPTVKMMQELGLTVCNSTLAHRYRPLIDALVVDRPENTALAGLETLAAPTLMQTLQDREQLAYTVLALADRLRGATPRVRRL